MGEKKRLYEVFKKVNNLPLNEEVYNDTEAMDTFIDKITNEIENDFSRNTKMFNDGVPQQVDITSIDYDNFRLVLDDTNGIVLERSINTQLQYVANYKAVVGEYPIKVNVPFTVDVENGYDGGKVVFYTRTFHSPREIEVRVER